MFNALAVSLYNPTKKQSTMNVWKKKKIQLAGKKDGRNAIRATFYGVLSLEDVARIQYNDNHAVFSFDDSTLLSH